jgi:hypothetical protein
MAGLEFRETMTGTWHRVEAPLDERPIQFTVRAQVHGLRRFLFQKTAEITGEIDARGLADHRALRGTMEIDPLLGRRIVYDFTFQDNEGQEHRFHGEKEIEHTRLVKTMTTLPGSLWQGEREVGRAVLRFHLREDLFRMLRSFKRR